MEAASDTGAEFDENVATSDQPHKVVVNTRPRVEKPSERPPEAPTKTKVNLTPDTDESELQAEATKNDQGSDKAAVDMLAREAADKKNAPQVQDEATQQHIHDLVEAKTYFVPIGQVTKRRHTTVLVIILIILIAAAAAAYFGILA